MEQIKIMYHTDIEKITKISVGDWIDLRAADNIFVPEGEYALIPLGVSMKLPEGYEAHIVPRSSTFKNWGLIQTNHCGVIDSSYCGNDDMWMYPVYCLDGKGYANDSNGIPTKGTMIKKNDRICQFRIMKKQPVIAFVEVDHLEDINRGGFGSTGKQ